MSAPGLELQKAIRDALIADAAFVSLLGGAKIYDHAPAQTPYPYVTFGRTAGYDWSTGTERGLEQLLTLHVWSKGKGKAEAETIVARLRSLLEQGGLALETHHLVSLVFDYAEVRYDDDLTLYHGLLRFRALLEIAG